MCCVDDQTVNAFSKIGTRFSALDIVNNKSNCYNFELHACACQMELNFVGFSIYKDLNVFQEVKQKQ